MTRTTCEGPIQSICRLPPIHPGGCMDEADIALRAQAAGFADLQAQLAQAVEAKKSATVMSEERLARALRAEDRLQLRAEIADDGALQAAEDRARRAEARVKDLEAVKEMMEAYRDERREALRVLNTDFYSIGDLQGDPSWLTPAAAFKLRKLLNEEALARADAAETRLHGDRAEALKANGWMSPEEATELREASRLVGEAVLRRGAGLSPAPRMSFLTAKDLNASGWLNPEEAAKLRHERDHAVDKCRAAIAQDGRARPSAEQQKLEDGVEEAMRRLDGIAGEITIMRKRLKGSLE